MMKLIKIVTIATISLSLGLLTGCGGSGSSNKNVTTISCSSTPYYNSTSRAWQYSQTDTRACTPLPNTTSGTCTVGQIKVRVPINNGSSINNNLNCPVINGVQNCNTMTPFNPGSVNTNNGWNNNNNTTNENYHTVAGQYTEKCLNQGDNSLGYVYSAGSYYYVNVQQLQSDVWSYQYNYRLSPGETLGVIGGLALLYLILN